MLKSFSPVRSVLCVVLALFWALPITGLAQDGTPTLYDVEIILFRNLNSKPTPEDWAFEEAQADRGKTKSTDEQAGSQDIRASSDEALPTVQTLPPEQLKLSALAATLRANRNYQLISHLAWTQAAATLRSDPGTALGPLLGVDSPVNGNVRLLRGTTLRLGFDLRVRNEQGPSYVLQETRQIKLGEKHFFDHPYFGVIAMVSVHRPSP